ncbi:putative quinol--cytochrome-c reductase, Mitochondrial processing peptidase [Helianthus anomalus]
MVVCNFDLLMVEVAIFGSSSLNVGLSVHSHPYSLFSFIGSSSLICYYALAFELSGGWLKEKEAMTLTVLQKFHYVWVIVVNIARYVAKRPSVAIWVIATNNVYNDS